MRRLVLLLVAAAGCSSQPNDEGAKAKLASDLVTCQNDLLTMKEQLAEAKAQLAKAQADATTKLEAIDVKAALPGTNVKHMEGNVSPDAVVKVVRQNSTGLRQCYEKALKRKPDLQYISTVTAHFLVRSTGAAQDVSFSPHTDADMEHCMASTMEKWKFPIFQGDPVAFLQPVNLVAK